MDFVQEVPLRALFEHDKSTPVERKFYVTLGYVALPEGLYVKYCAMNNEDVAFLREIHEFSGISKRGRKRFELVERNFMSDEERDYIAETAKEVFV